MRALHIIKPNGDRSAVTYAGIQAPLELLQLHVGGTIAMVRVRYHGKLRDAYMHDSGVLECLEPNPFATILGAEYGYGTLYGPMVIDLPQGRP